MYDNNNAPKVRQHTLRVILQPRVLFVIFLQVSAAFVRTYAASRGRGRVVFVNTYMPTFGTITTQFVVTQDYLMLELCYVSFVEKLKYIIKISQT